MHLQLIIHQLNCFSLKCFFAVILLLITFIYKSRHPLKCSPIFCLILPPEGIYVLKCVTLGDTLRMYSSAFQKQLAVLQSVLDTDEALGDCVRCVTHQL
jgi:hypothetical protein